MIIFLYFSDALQEIITALYCKLLIILGLAFPMAEQISVEVSVGTYQLFYVYLYLGSLLFLVFIYIDVMRTRAGNVVTKKEIVRKMSVKKTNQTSLPENSIIGTSNQLASTVNSSSNPNPAMNDTANNAAGGKEEAIDISTIIEKIPILPRPRVHYGSFYLRVGCVGKYCYLALLKITSGYI